MPLRLFIALAPPSTTRQALLRLRDSLPFPPPARPIPANNLHLTLVFLGQTPDARLAELHTLLQELPSLDGELQLDQLGAFERANVVWAGSSTTPPQLTQTAALLREKLAARNFGFDSQPFKTHVTLFRKAQTSLQALDPPILWPLTTPQLFASISTPQGPHYRLLSPQSTD